VMVKSSSFALVIAVVYTLLCLTSFALQPQEIKTEKMQKMSLQGTNIGNAEKSTEDTIISIQENITNGESRTATEQSGMQRITINTRSNSIGGETVLDDDQPTVGEVYVAGDWITAAIFPEGKCSWNAVIMESRAARKAKLVGKHFLGLSNDRVRGFEPVSPIDPLVGSWKIESVINLGEISRNFGRRWVKENGFSNYFDHEYEETITKTKDGFSISSSISIFVNTYSFVKEMKGKLPSNGKTFQAKAYYTGGKCILLHEMEDTDGLLFHLNVARHMDQGKMVCEICLVKPTGEEAKCIQVSQPKPFM